MSSCSINSVFCTAAINVVGDFTNQLEFCEGKICGYQNHLESPSVYFDTLENQLVSLLESSSASHSEVLVLGNKARYISTTKKSNHLQL